MKLKNFSTIECLSLGVLVVAALMARGTRDPNSIFFVVAGVVCVLHALVLLSARIEAIFYQKIQGQIGAFVLEDTERESIRSYSFGGTIEYSYEINGKRYASNRVNLRPLGFRTFCGDPSIFFDLQRAFVTGEKIHVYVNKYNNASSVLTLRVDAFPVVFLALAGCGMFGLDLFLAYFRK